jgi:hypothetical protein
MPTHTAGAPESPRPWGSASPDFVNSELSRLLNALNSKAGAPSEEEVNGAIALIHGMAPRSELEATLGLQIAAPVAER